MGKGVIQNYFEKCLSERKIVKDPSALALVERECQVAGDDLVEAEHSLKERKYKWATIQAYYSMFHTARALVASKGYREKGHTCLIIAVHFLFIEHHLIDEKFIRYLKSAKKLRENADYDNRFSENAAEEQVIFAREFYECGRKILEE